jgi:hypothetical protein
MNAHKRAEHLFIQAEKLGLDAPSEGMVADALNEAMIYQRQDIVMALRGKYPEAAQALENWLDLKTLEERKG